MNPGVQDRSLPPQPSSSCSIFTALAIVPRRVLPFPQPIRSIAPSSTKAVRIWVEGEPATFFTAREKDWRVRVRERLHEFELPPNHGITMVLFVAHWRRRGHYFDLDKRAHLDVHEDIRFDQLRLHWVRKTNARSPVADPRRKFHTPRRSSDSPPHHCSLNQPSIGRQHRNGTD